MYCLCLLRRLLFLLQFYLNVTVLGTSLFFDDFGSLWPWSEEPVACTATLGIKPEALYGAYHEGKFLCEGFGDYF